MKGVGNVGTLNHDEAVRRACEEPTLVKALAFAAVWESERVVRQALDYRANGVSTVWDTCFERCLGEVLEQYEGARPRRPAGRIASMQVVKSFGTHDVEKRCAEQLRQGWRLTLMVASGGLVHAVFEKGNIRDADRET